MTQERKSLVRLIYSVFLALFTAVIGILFIVQAANIYQTATNAGATSIYTPEIIAEKFAQIAIPVWLFVAAVVAGGVLFFVFPPQKQPLKAERDAKKTLARLSTHVDVQTSESTFLPKKAIQKERLSRKIAWGICLAVCAIALTFSLIYLLNGKNFPAEDVTKEVKQMLLHVLPWVVASVAVCLAAIVFEGMSVKRETEHVKKLIAMGNRAAAPYVAKQRPLLSVLSSDLTVNVVRAVLFAVGAAFVGIGIANGGMHDVLVKAINICTECIGLG